MAERVLEFDRDVRAELRTWLDGLSGIARRVNEAASFSELLGVIAATTCDLAGYDFCAILLPNEQRTALLIRGSYGLRPEYVSEINARRPIRVGPTPHGEAPTSRAFRYQRPVHVRDLWEDPSCAPWETVGHEQGNRSLLSLPLITSRGTMGVLNCYTRQLRDFSGDDIVFMETLANQAALAIETATLRSRERATIERLDSLNRQLREQHASMRQAEHAHQEMMRLVLEDQSLDDLASSLSAVTSSSVLIVDTYGKLLAAEPADVPSPLHRYACQVRLGDDAAPGRPQEPFAEAIRVPLPGSGAGLPAVVAPVLLGGDVAAHLWSVKQHPGGGHTGAEQRIVERAAVITALILSRQRIAQEAEWRVSRDLLDELLLRGDRLEADGVLDWGRRLGVDLQRPHVLLVVGSPHAGGLAPSTNVAGTLEKEAVLGRAQQVLRGAAVQGVATARGGEVIALVPAGSDGRGQRSVNDLARLLLRNLRPPTGTALSVAISPECDQVKEYPGAYHSARRALQLFGAGEGAGDGAGGSPGDGADGAGRIVDVRRLGIYRVLLNAARPAELARFAREVLAPLEEYDVRHKAELVRTLRAFLKQGGSAAASAKQLFVHTNTVRYRVRKAEELLGISLANEEDRLQVTLALLVQNSCEAD